MPDFVGVQSNTFSKETDPKRLESFFNLAQIVVALLRNFETFAIWETKQEDNFQRRT